MNKFFHLPLFNFFILFGCIVLLCLVYCKQTPTVEDIRVWEKVKINFSRLDNEGLSGSQGGKVAANYEFCIPKDATKWKLVQKIDSTTKQYKGHGRIGCTSEQWLIIGSTHQKNYRRVLYQLASLDFIDRIEETYWE